MTENYGNILVVDDTPDNLRLLAAMLSDRGYKVRKALSGSIALNSIRQIPPDLILLDINMPGMSGYEVCHALKQDPQTQDLPIIFISALDDVLDKVKAFEVGGNDYITKPFQGDEVCARIEHQLTIQRQKQQLQQEICDRKKAEDALQIYLHAVSHDLRNPVLGMTLVLRNLLKQFSPTLSSINVPFSTLERMAESCDRQLHLINSLIETEQYDQKGIFLQRKPILLYEFSQKLVIDWQLLCEQQEARLINQIPTNLPPIDADIHQLWRVFDNLLANALKHNPPGITLRLSAETATIESDREESLPKAAILCRIEDNGGGIESIEIELLFNRYQRGNNANNRQGLGLGLYLCRQIVEAHGGKIGVRSDVQKGTTFWFTLPQAETEKS